MPDDWVIEDTGGRDLVHTNDVAAYCTVFEAETSLAAAEQSHYWVATLMFKVEPPLRDGHTFAAADLRAGPLIICFICDQPWTPDADPRCPGEPDQPDQQPTTTDPPATPDRQPVATPAYAASAMNTDTVVACAHLAERSGAKGFELGYTRDDVPIPDAGWYAFVTYQGGRIITEEHRSPSAAALALAERLLAGATCKCTRPVTVNDTTPGCRWRLVGDRWQPGCNAPTLTVHGNRGDLTAAAATAMQARRNAPATGLPNTARRGKKKRRR